MGVPVLRGNTFDVGTSAAVAVAWGGCDLGTGAEPGNNVFVGGTPSLNVLYDATVSAVGNTWQTNPPVCGTEILTDGGGSVQWGLDVGEKCP